MAGPVKGKTTLDRTCHMKGMVGKMGRGQTQCTLFFKNNCLDNGVHFNVTVRSLVHQILNRKDDSTSVMNELGQLLDTHVRREERIVFPMIEKALPEEELQHLRPYLHTPED